ncbi:MAG: RodZ domain-containing protein [Halanaerobium sp.]
MELELGTLLKKAREEKGLSLDDIQEETKIRKKYLEAIEENNFDILPGKVYLKVFIKGYAREVDINYQALLENYEVLNIKEEKESNLQKDYLDGTKVSSGSKNKDRKNPFKIIFIILLILFLGAAVVYTYQYINNSKIRLLNQQQSQGENIKDDSQLLEVDEKSNTKKEPENEEEINASAENSSDNLTDASDNDLNSTGNEADNDNLLDSFDSSIFTEENTEIIDQSNFNGPEGPDAQEQNQISEIIVSDDFNNQQESIDESQTEDDGSGSDNSEEAAVNEEDDEETAVNEEDDEEEAENEEDDQEAVLDNNIEISANDTVWVTVDVDGTNRFSGILEAGDNREFEIENELYIKIGNSSAVTASIDGEQYGPWTESGGIAEIEFLLEDNEVIINNLRE